MYFNVEKISIEILIKFHRFFYDKNKYIKKYIEENQFIRQNSYMQ